MDAIDEWGRIFYELRHKMAESHCGREQEILKDATFTMHPEDYSAFQAAALDTQAFYDDSPQYMGLRLLVSALTPEGVALVIARNELIATVNLDTRYIRIAAIYQNA